MDEFIEHLHEVFSEFGAITARRMFGGYGIYHDVLMFALVADNTLYLKADKFSVERFIELELPPFEYEKGGKKMKMSYFRAPEEIFDDPHLAEEWATLAFEAALRAKK
ncbi:MULTISPECIES: TfoX/Sxy family protein [Thiomicrorhabdus]|uniref:TfoX/Sxy family protein n=1 Tax=Thiomicrorhabdus heinhorstiae TaxID=2748010 RepID=A0ABS0BYH8_9GAMM|nr:MULTISPECIES: TfoX/Sxy family protein [Thiomicrorhabdus]MBF6057016.1 TfoX/Sxy family protein [Thiomicrorhabdus heinhorstiae]